jgi:hypothetical protein
MLHQPLIDLTSTITSLPPPQALASPIQLPVGEHLAPISELGEHNLEGRINVDAQSAQRSVNQAYRTVLPARRSIIDQSLYQTMVSMHPRPPRVPPIRPFIPAIFFSSNPSRSQTPQPRADVIDLCTPPRRKPKVEIIDLSLSPLRPSVKRKHAKSPRIQRIVDFDLSSPPRAKNKTEPKVEPIIPRIVTPAPGAIVEGKTYPTVESAIADIYYHEEQRVTNGPFRVLSLLPTAN